MISVLCLAAIGLGALAWWVGFSERRPAWCFLGALSFSFGLLLGVNR